MNILKRNGRSSFRSTKRYNFSKTYGSYSNSKSRTKGNVNFEHLYLKYIKLAKEASSTGDRIQAEYYYQFADHYSRNMAEAAVKSVGNENINEVIKKDNADNSSIDSSKEISKSQTNDEIVPSEKNNIKDKISENENSLDTVSFIAQPAKKTSKLKK